MGVLILTFHIFMCNYKYKAKNKYLKIKEKFWALLSNHAQAVLRPQQAAVNIFLIIKEPPLWGKKNSKEQKSVSGKEKGSEELDINLAKWSSERNYDIVHFFPLFSQIQSSNSD